MSLEAGYLCIRGHSGFHNRGLDPGSFWNFCSQQHDWDCISVSRLTPDDSKEICPSRRGVLFLCKHSVEEVVFLLDML